MRQMYSTKSMPGTVRRIDSIFFIGIIMVFQTFLHTVAQVTEDPPAPEVALTNMLPKTDFQRSMYAMWEPNHAAVSPDEASVALMLDHISGCGIKSIENYNHGFFSASIKLPGNYSAGVVTTFYMSNSEEYPHNHDELDFEFLGTIPGEPYTIQTNVYGNGRTKVGREQRFRLWFDPTEDFHDYSFLWNENHTVYLVDNIPIWEFPNSNVMGDSYPSKPMSLYGTIWDASRWATDGGRYEVNYVYQPFIATYSNLIVNGCNELTQADTPDTCPPIFNEKFPPGLSSAQLDALHWVQSNHRFYSYCTDYVRYPDLSLIPECLEERSRAGSAKAEDTELDTKTLFLRIPADFEYESMRLP